MRAMHEVSGPAKFARRALAIALAAAATFGADVAGAALVPGAPGLGGPALVALLGAHVLAVALAFLLGGLAALAARAARRRTSSRHAAHASSALLAALAAGPADAIGRDLTSGVWISSQSWAPALRFGLLGTALATAWLLGLLLSSPRARATSAGGRRLVGLCGAVAAGALVADALVAPGAYPSGHLALFAVAVSFASLGSARALDIWPPTKSRRGTVGSGALATAALIVTASAFLRMDIRTRADVAALSLNARTALLLLPGDETSGRLLHALRSDEPGHPPATAREVARAAAQVTGGPRPRDVIWIVVDTLRADVLPPLRREGEVVPASARTPFLDQWLGASYQFRRAYSQGSMTRVSMPTLFRSLAPHESDRQAGRPLGERFESLGYRTVAVVPQYFLLPIRDSAQAELDGFGEVAFVPKDEQDTLVDLAAARLTRPAGDPRPLLAWIHFYVMHAPYFAGRLPDGDDDDARERYGRALAHLDGQLRALFERLDALGVSQEAIIVLTSDHGESLGDRDYTGHGDNVFDEEVRVPLAVRLPGAPGGVIDETVGGRDVLPTVLSLIGAPPDATSTGRSLAPLLAGSSSARDSMVAYPLANGDGTVRGVVRGTDKLVYDTATNTALRFDLARDPGERHNLFDPEGALEQSLFSALLLDDPRVAVTDLTSAATRTLVTQALDSADAAHAGSSRVAALLRVVGATRDPGGVEAAASLFGRATTDRARLAVAHLLARADPELASSLLGDHLVSLAADPERELEFVRGLAILGLGPTAPDHVAARLDALALEPTEHWRPWLALPRRWPKHFDRWAPPLGVLLDEGRTDAPTTELMTLIAELDGVPRANANAARLLSHATTAVTRPEPSAAAAAVAAVGRLGDHSNSAALRALVDDGRDRRLPVRVRQAVMHAVASIEGEDAVDLIVALGHDPLLTVDAIFALGQLRSPRGAEFLEHVAAEHYNAYTRGWARDALGRLEGR